MIGGTVREETEQRATRGAEVLADPEAAPEQATVRTRWVSIAEAAGMLRISEVAVRKRIADRSLPALRAGRSWRVLLAGEVPDASPPKMPAQLRQAGASLPADPAAEQLESMVVLLRDLQRQNLALAGHIGYLQSQLQDAQERARSADGQRQQLESEIASRARVDRDEHQAALDEIDSLQQRLREYEGRLPDARPKRPWWRPFR